MSTPSNAPASYPLAHIAASNLVTALGDDGLTTAAAWVSGRRCQKLHELSGAKLYTAPVNDIVGKKTGTARLQALLDALLSNTLPAALQQAPQTHQGSYSTHCQLLLPDWLTPDESQAFGNSIYQLLQTHSPQDMEITVNYSTANNTMACHNAAHRLLNQATTRRARRWVMIAVDSLCEASVLQRNHTQGLVAHTAAKKLDTAGEAAAWVVLDSAETLRHIPRKHMALHQSALTPAGTNPRWNSPTAGDGKLLAQTIEQALQAAHLRLDNLSHRLDDNDDQRWRNEDCLGALSHLSHKYQTHCYAEDLGIAERIGHTGVATGVLHWALVHTLQQHKLMNISTALSCIQHPSGANAAVVLQRTK